MQVNYNIDRVCERIDCIDAGVGAYSSYPVA